MAGLAAALVGFGCKVIYVAEQPMSVDRVAQGWALPVLTGVTLVYAATPQDVQAVVDSAPLESIHICQGIRGNGLVSISQRALSQRGLRQWVLMETLDDTGLKGLLRRLEYSRLFLQRRRQVQGILAIGHRTPAWVAARGVQPDCVFPFAYFLPATPSLRTVLQRAPGPFRFVFVGQLITRKRVDWLINALAEFVNPAFELSIVGVGPEERPLRALAGRLLVDRVRWLGKLPMPEVPGLMAQADCLVLPSLHDGWGAVVSEALMAGTPAICSDACGAAGVVRASGCGGVYSVNDQDELQSLLHNQMVSGVVTEQARRQLATWATSLGADAGGRYLLEILAFKETGSNSPPVVPWLRHTR